ncbi:MAG: hypothetical protein MHPSP_004835, partial [Paramarteilia canceri]
LNQLPLAGRQQQRYNQLPLAGQLQSLNQLPLAGRQQQRYNQLPLAGQLQSLNQLPLAGQLQSLNQQRKLRESFVGNYAPKTKFYRDSSVPRISNSKRYNEESYEYDDSQSGDDSYFSVESFESYDD